MEVKGKNIIVTGAANGIGKNLVQKLAKFEANIFAIDINNDALRALKKELPQVNTLACDLSDAAQVEETIGKIAADCSNSIDVLVNNAGVIYNSPLVNFFNGAKHPTDEWNRVISNNLNSVFYTTVNTVEYMVKNRTKGVIVNVSSICATGNPGQGAYSATKAAVEALTKSWAKELGPLGIRFTCVAPGYCETETTMTSINPAMVKGVKEKIPQRRFATVEEIVGGIYFTIENDYFNGKILPLDGGLNI